MIKIRKESEKKARDIDNITIKLDEESGSASDMAILTY